MTSTKCDVCNYYGFSICDKCIRNDGLTEYMRSIVGNGLWASCTDCDRKNKICFGEWRTGVHCSSWVKKISMLDELQNEVYELG
jgi:hypothetical protein